MSKSVLLLLLFFVSASAAARDFVWAWDTPGKKQGNVNHNPVSGVSPSQVSGVNPSQVSKWVEVARQNTHIILANPAFISRNGNLATMSYWYELQMIDEVGGEPFRSVIVRSEYNCMNEQARTLSALAYGRSMSYSGIPLSAFGDPGGAANAGSIVKSGSKIRAAVNKISEPGKWKPVAPGSTQEILFKFACAK